MSVPTAKLINNEMPILGFGTWQLSGADVRKVLKTAIINGARHIDCAAAYVNETQVGEALKEVFAEGIVKREDLWITTKIWNTCHAHVEECLRNSLKELQLEYVDLTLVHWPVAFEFTGLPVDHSKNIKDEAGVVKKAKVSHEQTWRGMEKLVDLKLSKYIGVSNYNTSLLRDLTNYARIQPVCNQIEVHPYNTRYEHIAEAKSLGVEIVAYSPLGSGKSGCLTDPVIVDIAKRVNATPAQVILGWIVAQGVSAIPRTSNPERTLENSRVAVGLTEQDIKAISALNKNEQLADINAAWGVAHCSTKSIL